MGHKVDAHLAMSTMYTYDRASAEQDLMTTHAIKRARTREVRARTQTRTQSRIQTRKQTSTNVFGDPKTDELATGDLHLAYHGVIPHDAESI